MRMDIAKLMINEKAFMADTDAVYSFKRYIKEGKMEVNVKVFKEPLCTWSINISNINTDIYVDAFTLQYKINRQLDNFRFVGGVPMCNVFGILGINELIPANIKLECAKLRLNFCDQSDIELFPHVICITGLRSGKYDFEDWEKDLGIVHKELELQWRRPVSMPRPEKVIFNNPATIVIWSDGTRTVVKCGKGDTYSKETGLALCYMKKVLGNKGNYNDVFRKWIKEDDANG